MQKYKRIACVGVLGWLVGCGPPMSERPQEADATPPKEAPFQAKVAEVGVGIKGKSLEGEQGVGKIISQPAVTLFRTKEKIVFEIAIPQAMNLYQASNGRFPKSHEEFMETIIKFNNIQLPKLPEGQVYVYHPDDGKLWVEPAAKE